jgi:hypothetical protein
VAKLGKPSRCRRFGDTAVLALESHVGGVQNLGRHAPQRFDVVVTMGARAQIDLGERV